ncbi:MAG: 50S ribosomal protein L13 [Gemmatales bacterium]|nr:50S ribosomal protein L13 [Gemmatales bacterium]MDW8388381.1 50S ribosomal protein L13 [Gemmatales bacterium]
MSSYMAKPGELEKKWHLVDATGMVVGRLAAEIARILIGKHRPEYTPHVDTGDFVVVVNAEKVVLTGKKMDTKIYQWFTGYPGGRKIRGVREMLAKHPERVLREAVRRMMPKNKLARHQLAKLKVYAGPNHPHQAQQVKPLDLTGVGKVKKIIPGA